MFDPGTRWQYGSNIDWVGRIVEAVSGERLDVYFRKHILGPLGMTDTGFVVLRILRGDTVALMGQNQIGHIEAGILKSTNPAVSNDVDFFPRIPLRWGLGHMINMEPGLNGRSAGSLTWAGLLNTYYWIDPTKRVAAVFMTQVLPFADRPALALYQQFERGIYAAVNAS